MKFDIRNRWTGAVQFTAEIECDESATSSVRVGLAVRWAIINGARLVDASLDGARLVGARLDGARLDGARLDGARLDGASLDGASLVGASLVGARLDGASLVGASLVGASLDDARLVGARLDGARLDGARLDGAKFGDLNGVPVIPNIHQAVYAAASGEGALDMSAWHTCDTTHSRAGWVVTLAGAGGKALEWAIDTGPAAAMIYLASDPTIERIPDWTATEEDALADMKRLAELEAARNAGAAP